MALAEVEVLAGSHVDSVVEQKACSVGLSAYFQVRGFLS